VAVVHFWKLYMLYIRCFPATETYAGTPNLAKSVVKKKKKKFRTNLATAQSYWWLGDSHHTQYLVSCLLLFSRVPAGPWSFRNRAPASHEGTACRLKPSPLSCAYPAPKNAPRYPSVPLSHALVPVPTVLRHIHYSIVENRVITTIANWETYYYSHNITRPITTVGVQRYLFFLLSLQPTTTYQLATRRYRL